MTPIGRGRARRDAERIFVNGINASTGKYIENPLRRVDVEKLARRVVELGPTQDREQPPPAQGLFLFEMAPPSPDWTDLAQAGWGVLFHRDADPRIREALQMLLEWRHRGAPGKRCAGELYREFLGEDGFHPGDTWETFRQRHEIATGQAVPLQMPYYVLIVGDPEVIPYTFQYAPDIQRAVGRVSFEKMEDYENYARSVVRAESGSLTPQSPRKASIFAPANPDDKETRHSLEQLAVPVHVGLNSRIRPEWEIQLFEAAAADKQQLARLLGGPDTPSLLFTTSHGAGFDRDDPRWPRHQGALIPQDWPGPVDWAAPLEPEHYFSADDIDDTADLRGLIAIFVACYSAGTPRLNDFIHVGDAGANLLSDAAFVAALPQKLLSHPRGALAVVGHVERAWDTTFREFGDGQPVDADPGGFRSLIHRVAAGEPLGLALDGIADRSAELGRNLADEILAVQQGAQLTPELSWKIARLWTASMDARNFVILGDPAVRVP